MPDFKVFITWSDIHIRGGITASLVQSGSDGSGCALDEPQSYLESSNTHIWLHMCSVTPWLLSSFPEAAQQLHRDDQVCLHLPAASAPAGNSTPLTFVLPPRCDSHRSHAKEQVAFQSETHCGSRVKFF